MSTRIHGIALLLLLVLSLSACQSPGGQAASPLEQKSFLAKVIEVRADSATVEAFEDEAIRLSSDRFSFDTANLADLQALPGDTVRIVYAGEIRESHPALIDVQSWTMEEKKRDRSLLGLAPPILRITYAGQSKDITHGSSTWSFLDPKSKDMLTLHSTAALELDNPTRAPNFMKTSDRKLSISFPVAPDSVSVRYWNPDKITADTVCQEVLLPTNGQLMLPQEEGSFNLEVIATWLDDGSGSSHGTASYCLLIKS